MKLTRALSLISFLILVITLSNSWAKAQSSYEIEGVIYAPNSTPVSGIAVFLEDSTRSRIGQAITDGDGRYRFSRIPPGLYFITVKPNDRKLQSVTQRVELINTTVAGSNSPLERVDINLAELPRFRLATASSVFAQDVPPPAEAEYEKAMESASKKDNEQAVRRLSHAVELFPNYFKATQQLGLIYVELEQYRQAIPPLVKSIEINPEASTSYLALGISSLKLGRADLALDALERAKRLGDKSFRLHFFLGLTLLELNRLDEAEKSLKESYKLGGPNKAASAHLYLASIYSKRSQYREAIAELESYLRDNPKAGNMSEVRVAINNLKSKL